jgi:hypothetical protein
MYNSLSPDAPYFIILLSLTPDDFTRQGESTDAVMYNSLSPDAPYFIILLSLTPDDFTRQGESTNAQWVNWPICPCV